MPLLCSRSHQFTVPQRRGSRVDNRHIARLADLRKQSDNGVMGWLEASDVADACTRIRRSAEERRSQPGSTGSVSLPRLRRVDVPRLVGADALERSFAPAGGARTAPVSRSALGDLVEKLRAAGRQFRSACFRLQCLRGRASAAATLAPSMSRSRGIVRLMIALDVLLEFMICLPGIAGAPASGVAASLRSCTSSTPAPLKAAKPSAFENQGVWHTGRIRRKRELRTPIPGSLRDVRPAGYSPPLRPRGALAGRRHARRCRYRGPRRDRDLDLLRANGARARLHPGADQPDDGPPCTSLPSSRRRSYSSRCRQGSSRSASGPYATRC